MTADRDLEAVAAVLEAHVYMPCSHVTPGLRAFWAQCEGCEWKGPRRTERNSPENDHDAHVAAALLPLIREREAAAWERALREVRTLADEWKAEGGSLVMHAYSGRDVHEGQTLERCAYELRDRAAANPYAGSEGA